MAGTLTTGTIQALKQGAIIGKLGQEGDDVIIYFANADVRQQTSSLLSADGIRSSFSTSTVGEPKDKRFIAGLRIVKGDVQNLLDSIAHFENDAQVASNFGI